MKRQPNQQEMKQQMQRIQKDVQRIASEVNSLVVMATPATTSGGNFKRSVRDLQGRVDRLRRTLWRVQTASEAQVVPFPRETAPSETEAEHSLVDRVLALLDRRCG